MSGAQTAALLNSHFNWDLFDPEVYRDHNYQSVRDDDQRIVRTIRNFFAQAGVENGRGIDVGPGPNLYPSLAMLPFCESLDLWEFSTSNVDWLNKQIQDYDPNWDKFWTLYQECRPYRQLVDPRGKLHRITTVHQASIFDLPAASWDLGTMFFVACSISADIAEFEKAVHCFVRSLKRHAPFAAAFMAQSDGYPVGDAWFPAVAVGRAEVEQCLEVVARYVHVEEIKTSSPLREGVGMIVATGRAAS
jgi:hypothetical protein